MKKQTLFVMVAILFFFGVKNNYSQGRFWSTKTGMHVARALLSTCNVDGILYAIGGALNATTSIQFVEAYDAISDSWSFRKDIPQPLCGSAACTLFGKIFIIGGNNGGVYGKAVTSVYMYDPALDSWTQKSDFPIPIQLAAACIVNNETIYVIGGTSTGFHPSYSTVYEYDFSSDKWTKKTDMHVARFCHSATVVDGKIYIFGGSANTSLTAIDVCEVYDPATDTCNMMTPMKVGRYLHTASAVDGKIYIFGGTTGNTEMIYENVDEYDPVLNTWSTESTIPTARWGLNSCTIGEKIYTIGGADNLNHASSKLEVFNPLFNQTDVEDLENSETLPIEYSLYQNFPNPFNPTTKICWQSPVSSWNTLKVYDAVGSEVATLINEYKQAGEYEVTFDGSNLPSGVYFYQLRVSALQSKDGKAGEFVETKKMILIK